MKNLGTILAAVFLALVLLLYMCTFQVRFTEVAIRKTLGRADATPITEPSLYFKWPRPIQSVVKYDKRIRLLEDRTEETRTVDGKNVLLTTYTLWKIGDPAKFHTNFPASEEDGERKLRTTVVTHKHSVTGRRTFNEFVSINPAERKLREIEDEIEKAVDNDARDQFGIEVLEIGIKKLALPESVTANIFNAMKTHEEAKAGEYTTQGEARARTIVAEAQAAEERILSAARQKASELETEAQAVVGTYYKEFDKHPELRIFLDGLRTSEEALQQRTTLIIDTNTFPWNLFNQEARDKLIADGADKPQTVSKEGTAPKGSAAPRTE